MVQAGGQFRNDLWLDGTGHSQRQRETTSPAASQDEDEQGETAGRNLNTATTARYPMGVIIMGS